MQVRGAKVDDVAYESRFNKLFGSQGSREKPVLKRHLSLALKIAQGCFHSVQVCFADSEGFITVNVFAGRHRGQQLFRMQAIGRADVDDMNIIPREQIPKICREELKLIRSSPAEGLLALSIRHPDQLCSNSGPVIVERHTAVAMRMDLSHKPETDDSYPQSLHCAPPPARHCPRRFPSGSWLRICPDAPTNRRRKNPRQNDLSLPHW